MRKKTNILLLILFISNALFAQTICFNKRYDINSGSELTGGVIETDSGYLIDGYTTYPDRLFTMFIDTLGIKKWEKTYYFKGCPYSYSGLAGSLIKSGTSDYTICGFVSMNFHFDTTKTLLFKTNLFGDTLWTKTYNLNNLANAGRQCKQTEDKGFIICGDISLPNPGNIADFFLIKTDSNGLLQWWKNYGDNKIEVAYNVMQTPEKDYLNGGIHYYLTGNNYHADPMIVKTDSMGNFKWSKLLGGPNDDYPAMVCMAKNSNYIVAYTYTEYFSQDYCFSRSNITKLDTAGNIIWNKKYGPIYQNNNLTQIKPMPDGGFLVCGFANNPLFTFYQVGWMLRLKANGDRLWYREYANYVHNETFNELWDFNLTKDNGIIATGPLYPNSTGGTQDVWVIKTDSFGCLVPNCTGIGKTEFNPNAGAQMLVYPNPFNEAFAINYNIPKENKKAVFMLYDVYGKLIYETPLNTSINQLQVVASGLKNGVYVASLVVDGVVVGNQKIIKE